jgi:threonyl-tRNA synthetase
MIICGEKEAESNSVSIRLRSGKQMNGLTLDEAIDFIGQKISAKELI